MHTIDNEDKTSNLHPAGGPGAKPQPSLDLCTGMREPPPPPPPPPPSSSSSSWMTSAWARVLRPLVLLPPAAAPVFCTSRHVRRSGNVADKGCEPACARPRRPSCPRRPRAGSSATTSAPSCSRRRRHRPEHTNTNERQVNAGSQAQRQARREQRCETPLVPLERVSRLGRQLLLLLQRGRRRSSPAPAAAAHQWRAERRLRRLRATHARQRRLPQHNRPQ